MMISAVGVEEY